MDHVISVDPGTRNYAMCLLSYDTTGSVPTTMEQMLCKMRLARMEYGDMGTPHVTTACVRLAARYGTEWRWALDLGCDVVIERQGSPHSPIGYLCSFVHGLFLGHRAGTDAPFNTVLIDYPAASKFRGPWCEVAGKADVPLPAFALDTAAQRDPVKRAAVEAAARMLTWMDYDPAILERVHTERRQHDMCDAMLQGVSYLFRKHVQRDPDTKRVRSSCTLPVECAVENTAELLLMPREGRKRATRTTGVISKRTRRKYNVGSSTCDAEEDVNIKIVLERPLP